MSKPKAMPKVLGYYEAPVYEDDGENFKAKCKTCLTPISASNKAKSNLHVHLKVIQ